MDDGRYPVSHTEGRFPPQWLQFFHGAFEASKNGFIFTKMRGWLILRNIFKLLPLVVAIQGGPTILMHTSKKITTHP